nr:endonuclease V [Shimia biformata]
MAEQTCRLWPEDDPEVDEKDYDDPSFGLLMAVDVQYGDTGGAVAAGVLFRDWQVATPKAQVTAWIDHVAPYEPGAFFKRELPCILALLDRLETPPSAIVIDGYVTLGKDGRDGLGAHLYRTLEARIPVIGVAKTRFEDTPADTELRRGSSKHPLFVTAAGMSVDDARACIAAMHGDHRMPTLLTMVDRLARDGLKSKEGQSQPR